MLFELSVDWDNPANSTFDGPFFLPTAPFDVAFCGSGGFVACIPQPFPGELLDPFAGSLMHRLAFRNFDSHMAMVTNHTVDVGDFDDHAGIRWYELRNDGGGWSIFQQGTYAPDSDHRWMGSIAMNANGDIALGYSVSSASTFPSIRYTGRTRDAPLGEMNVAEQSLVEGTGAQLENYRWGDYSMMAVDPVDDATFWYTNEYYAETSADNFRTRIGAFKIDSSVVGIAEIPNSDIPAWFELSQNYPNPFNPETTIRYGLPRDENVTLKIYNLLGKEVATLLNNQRKTAGSHVAIWDGRNNQGRVVASGIYIYQLRAGEFSAIKKMAYVR